MKRKKIVSILFWIGFVIYGISLFLPYSIWVSEDINVNNEAVKEYISGIKLKAPLLSLVPIILMLIFTHIRYTNFLRWFSLICSVSLMFPLLPFYLFGALFCLYCESYIGLGFYLHIPACILFLIAMIINFRIPSKRNNEASKHELLDAF